MGVRSQRFLKGEDQLYFAAVLEAGVLFDLDGNPLPQVPLDAKRDSSGQKLERYIGSGF
jgi:hypothetical protein